MKRGWKSAGPAILCFIGLASATSISGQSLPAVAVDIDPVFARHGVTVIGWNDPQFRTAVEQVAGPEIHAKTNILDPYTLVLSSNGPSDPVLVVVRYQRVNGAGQVIDGQMVHIMPPIIASRQFVLMPDSVSSVAVNSHGKRQPPNFDSLIRAEYAAKFSPQIFPRGTVSLDLVIFADGGAIGPDRAGMFEVERGKAQIEAAMLAKLQDSSIPDDQIKSWLAGLAAKTAGVVGQDGRPNYLNDHEVGTAGNLLRAMSILGGRKQLADWYAKIQASRRPPASRLHRLEQHCTADRPAQYPLPLL